jgi:hypothetical protein
MRIGPSLIVACPHCGGEKKLGSSIYLCEYDERRWSDGKLQFPVNSSCVQKCNYCGSYFVLNKDLKYREAKDQCIRGIGTSELSYTEWKIAFFHLIDDVAPEDAIKIRFNLIYAYNDAFRKVDKYDDNYEIFMREHDFNDCERTQFDWKLQRENLIAAINHIRQTRGINNRTCLQIANYYRELGEFDACLDELKNVDKAKSTLRIKQMTKALALAKLRNVFLLYPSIRQPLPTSHQLCS